MIAADYVLKRQGELEALRQPHEPQWRQIARLMVPEKDDMFSGSARSDVATEIYDATQLGAIESFTGGIFGQLTNPADRWFELSLDDADLARWQPVREWLWACETAIYASLSPTASNFYSEVPGWFADLAGFGLGTFYQEEIVGENRIRDLAISLGEIFIDVDANGDVGEVHRKFKLKGAQAKAKFPEIAALSGVGDTTELTFVHAVCRNPDFVAGRLGPEGMPWASVTVCGELKAFMRTAAYWELPYHIVMWKRRPGRVYPVGPGHMALPDVEMLQEMERTHLVAAQYAAEPPLLVNEESDLVAADVRPNALLYGGLSARGGQLAQPLNRAQNLNLSMEQSKQRRSAIQEAFFFGLMQLMQRPQMTATEFLGFQEEKLRQMGPNLARIQSQGLSPLLTRRFRIMQRAGAFPPPPDELTNRRLEIAYVSPLAKMQKASLGKAVLNYAGSLSQLAQATGDPAVMDNLDGDAAAEVLHDAMGPPPSVKRDPAERDKIRDARAKQQADQQQLEQAGQAAEIAATSAHARQAATLSDGRASP